MSTPDLSVTEGSQGLEVENLRKSYKTRVVIRDFSMSLNRGEVVALLGPNGCGKSTTFYSIAGLVYPEGGHVKIDGRDVTGLTMYRRAKLGIGMPRQEPNQPYPDLNPNLNPNQLARALGHLNARAVIGHTHRDQHRDDAVYRGHDDNVLPDGVAKGLADLGHH